MGFFMAKGEFIAVQDSDDLSHPERLTRQVDYLRRHPHIDLVGTNYATFKDRIPDHPKKETWIHYGQNIRETYAKEVTASAMGPFCSAPPYSIS